MKMLQIPSQRWCYFIIVLIEMGMDVFVYGRQLPAQPELAFCLLWMLFRIAWSLNWMPLDACSGSISPVSIFAKIVFAHFRKDSSTFSPVFALVSKNIKSFSWAKLLASKNVTSRCSSRSFLLPTRIIMMWGLARVLVSLSQLANVLNDSRDVTS